MSKRASDQEPTVAETDDVRGSWSNYTDSELQEIAASAVEVEVGERWCVLCEGGDPSTRYYCLSCRQEHEQD